MTSWASISPFPNSNGLFWNGLAVLPSGKLLTVGGQAYVSGDILEPHCYLYDPLHNTWSRTGDLNALRTIPGIVNLDDGRVLAVGGRVQEDSGDPIASCEIYNPASGLWSFTGSLNVARNEMGIWKLSNGDVLVAGGSVGSGSFSQTNTTELYSVASGTWTNVGHDLAQVTNYPFYFSLADGTPILAGGFTISTSTPSPLGTYSYNASTGWTHVTDLPNEANTNDVGRIISLSDGRFMIAGASNRTFAQEAYVFIFDPNTMAWITAGSLNHARSAPFQGALENGKALVVGGETDIPTLVPGGEIYDPNTNTWTENSGFITNKSQSSTALLNGVWYSIGGALREPTATTADCETWTLPVSPSGDGQSAPSMFFSFL